MGKGIAVAQFPSATTAGRFYAVVNTDGVLSCDCPVYIFDHRGNKTCKHIDAVSSRTGLKPATKPETKPMPKGWVHPLMSKRNDYIKKIRKQNS